MQLGQRCIPVYENPRTNGRPILFGPENKAKPCICWPTGTHESTPKEVEALGTASLCSQVYSFRASAHGLTFISTRFQTISMGGEFIRYPPSALMVCPQARCGVRYATEGARIDRDQRTTFNRHQVLTYLRKYHGIFANS